MNDAKAENNKAIVLEAESGIVEEGRDDPRSSFQGQRLETRWDNLHVAYFSSYYSNRLGIALRTVNENDA